MIILIIVYKCAVLASRWVGKSLVCSAAIKSNLSQHYCMLLVCTTISLLVTVSATVKHFPYLWFHSVVMLLMLYALLSICRGIFLNLRARSMVLKKAWNLQSWFMNMATSPCVSWIENGSLELLILFWFSCFPRQSSSSNKLVVIVLCHRSSARQNVAHMVMWKVVSSKKVTPFKCDSKKQDCGKRWQWIMFHNSTLLM